MDNKFFDHIVKSKLENLTSDAAPRWDLFQEKKSVHDSMRADTAFDNDIRRTISEYTQPYNPNHWNLLKARLERIYSLRKALYSIKIYEVLAILIMFYTVGSNYDSILGVNPAMTTSANQPIALANDQVKNSDSKNIDGTLIEIADATTQTEIVSKAISNNTISNNAAGHLNNKIVTTQQIVKQSNSSNSITSEASSLSSNINNGSIIIDNALSYNRNNVISAVIEESASQVTDVLRESISHSDITNLKNIDGIAFSIESNSTAPSITYDNFGIKPLNNVMPDGKWLHVAASFDNNLITTPYNEIYNLGGPQSKEMFGYSLSGLFSIQKGNMEYETGLSYSVYNKPIAFRRPWENNRGDVFMYSLTNINYDILSVPLRAKYHFVNTSDWSLYITGGLSPEFIVNTGYDERDEKMNINVPTPQGPTEEKPELTESPFRTESNFHNGLFEQGSFKENFMLRAQIGAGMQRNITPTLSAFIAGDYFKSVLSTTYGPTDDSINKFSITFGIKERF